MEPYPNNDTLSFSNCALEWYQDLAPLPIRSDGSGVDTLDPDQRLNSTIVDEFHCKLFNLKDDEDMRLYRLIKQRIASSWYTQVKEITKWESADQPIYVWLEWIQSYRELTPAQQY